MSACSDLRLIQFVPAIAGKLARGRADHTLMPSNATRT